MRYHGGGLILLAALIDQGRGLTPPRHSNKKGTRMKSSGKLLLGVSLFGLSTMSAVAAHDGGMSVTGTIKAVAEKSFTIDTHDQNEVRIAIDEKTKFERNGKAATAKDLKPGARVVVDVEKGQTKETLMAKEVKIGSAEAIYTCPMHPEVQEKAPGKCAKCGMNLEPKA